MQTRSFTFELPGHVCSNCDAGYVLALEELQLKYNISNHCFKMDSTPHKIVINVENQNCPNEEIQQAILNEFQVIDEDARFLSIKTNTIHIPLDPERELAKASFQHEVIITLNEKDPIDTKAITNNNPQDDENDTAQSEESQKHFLFPYWMKGALGLVSGGALMALMISGITLSFPVTLTLAIISGTLGIYLGWDSFKTAFQRARKKTTSMDTLFAVSALIALGTSITSFFVPGLHMMFDAVLMIFGCRHLGFGIKNSINEKIYKTSKLTDCLSKKVLLKGSKHAIPAAQMKVGSVIIVQPGNIIPIDGICLSEQAFFIDQNDSGNIDSLEFKANDSLHAGMQLDSDSKPILMQATSTIQSSSLATAQQNLENAIDNKSSSLEGSAKKILKWFVPAVIVLAIAVGITMGILFPPLLAVKAVIAILASACPCALGLVVPTAAAFGMTKAKENGVEFTNKNKLQAASDIDTVVLDLNGTLTEGKPSICLDNLKGIKSKLLHAFAALEKGVKHPSGHAIFQHLTNRISGTHEVALKNIEKKSSNGIKALYKHNNKWLPIVIGNQAMMQECGIKTTLKEKAGKENYIYFACNNTIVGHITLEDKLKPEAKSIIRELRSMGKEVFICTGARQAAAQTYANELGIDDDHLKAEHKSTTTNQNKVSFIQSLKANGKRVAMIGDGMNDNSAMEEADFSIKIDSSISGPLLYHTPGAKITNRSLFPIVAAFETANQTIINIKQNIAGSLIFNILALGLVAVGVIALGFMLNPAIGAALMVVSASAASFWAYRLRKQPLEHTKHAQEMARLDQIHDGSSDKRIDACLSQDIGSRITHSRSVNPGYNKPLPRPLLSFTGYVPVVVRERSKPERGPSPRPG